MSQTANFGVTEQELIDKIVTYQKENNIKYFSEAVRNLCAYALKVKKIKN